jgi:hypothetical protein
MRRGCLILCLSLLTTGAATAAEPPDFSRHVVNSADAGYCSQVGDLWRCRQFAVQVLGEPSGGYAETRAWVDQWRNWPTGWASRHIECTVERHALKMTPEHAEVRAILDPASPACTTYGDWVEFDPETGEPVITPWLYTEPVVLEADLLAPAREDRHVSMVTHRDNATGETSREQCHGGNGYRLQGGGFTVLGLYREFGPEGADGSYFYETCGTMTR